MIKFKAKLLKPAKTAPWMFLRLPQAASDKLPSRGMVSVEGTFNGETFQATIEPDGEGGHWMKVAKTLQVGAKPGETVSLEISPMANEPEPLLPVEFKKALAAAPPKARETWKSITAAARRDYVFWMTSAKKAETRAKRIAVACDKLSKGDRRPCCFDRSGMYGKSLSCPVAKDQ